MRYTVGKRSSEIDWDERNDWGIRLNLRHKAEIVVTRFRESCASAIASTRNTVAITDGSWIFPMNKARRLVSHLAVGLFAIEATVLPAGASAPEGVWLKGDLHVHSRHSRDTSNHPIGKIVRYAEETGLDFLAITDHDNHVDGDVANHSWADPEWRSDTVILLYAAEWTTDRGHGNVFSSHPYDQGVLFRLRDARDAQIIAAKRGLNVHLSANHPTNKDHFGFSYDLVDSMEVWNSSNWAKNVPALGVWDDMLKSGRCLPARGGSDAHHGWPDAPAARSASSVERLANYIGTPTTWVFAHSRDRQGVIEALTTGHSSISASLYAPRVELTAAVDGVGRHEAMMGDKVKASGHPVSFHVTLVGGGIAWAQYQVQVIKDGEPLTQIAIDADRPEGTFVDSPAAGRRSYYRVEVQGPQSANPQVPMAPGITGTMIALSNPIYFNFDVGC